MDIRYLVVAGCLAVCIGLSQAAKRCDTQEVWGSRYNSDIDGLYDRTEDIRCQGRSVWRRRTVDAGSEQKYIYYYRDSVLRRGWIVGTNPCNNNREFASAYVWNTNQRPDRGLLAWLEYDQSDLRWRINGGFEVRCTEGLTYPQIVGIVCGCIFGLIVIGAGAALLFKFCRK